MDTKIHKFETAGLGLAPFRIVGVTVKTGPIRIDNHDGTITEIGAPGQPMGLCAFCGQGIAECWKIRSADGKQFEVGCECVRKTGDAGLKRGMAPELRRLRHEKDDARIGAAVAAIECEATRAKLAALPHPREDMAARGMTALDFCVWMFKNAGRAGKIRAARKVEEVTA